MFKPSIIPAIASLGLLVPALADAALVDPACDANGDGLVDDLPTDYAEGQQYTDMLNFYAASMSSSPLHAAAPLAPWRLDAGLELSTIPQLSCGERAVFGGYKTEDTNRSPVMPRLRATLGLPYGIYAGLGLVPPVPAFGVQTGVLTGELGYGHVLAERLELGARAALVGGRVVGDLAGPLPDETATEDTYKDLTWSVEGLAGLRVPIQQLLLTPYLGAGYTQVHASMHIGEDGVDVPGVQGEMGRMLYWGPHAELGAQLRSEHLYATLEAYALPLRWVDPGNPRFFLSPRLELGYTFF